MKDNWQLEFEKWKALKKHKEMGWDSKPAQTNEIEELKPSDVNVKAKKLESQAIENEIAHDIKSTSSRGLRGFIIFLAFFIPLLILGYFLYINYLPLGYDKTFYLSINNGLVDAPSELSLVDLRNKSINDLSKIKTPALVNLVLKPRVRLNDAELDLETIGGSYIGYKNMDFLEEDYNWAYFWDFNFDIPFSLSGSANYSFNEACAYFNSARNETLYLNNSGNLFESDNSSLLIFLDWMPLEAKNGSEQLIGHYNWEIWQNANSVEFRVGRMENANGSAYSIKQAIDSSFFGQGHRLLAYYYPDKINGSGYIELWLDDNLVGRKEIGNETLYKDYGNKDLSFGWTSHNYNMNPYYEGCIYAAGISFEEIEHEKTYYDLISVDSGKGVWTMPVVIKDLELIKLRIIK
jgi:hypothetical protein